jgi:hypothetical protein
MMARNILWFGVSLVPFPTFSFTRHPLTAVQVKHETVSRGLQVGFSMTRILRCIENLKCSSQIEAALTASG